MDGQRPRKIQKRVHPSNIACDEALASIAVRQSDDRENFAEDFIPRCSLITSNIFQYLSAKDLLNLSRVSQKWFTPCREYLRSHQTNLHCPLVLDQVDGLEALNSVIQVLDTEILGQTHPFTGVYLKFSNSIDDFFKVGSGPNKRPVHSVQSNWSEELPPMDPSQNVEQWTDQKTSGDKDGDYYEDYDFTQEYETFHEWMDRQYEDDKKLKAEEAERKQELAKLNEPLKRIFARIPFMKHVYINVNYGFKRGFNGEKFKRFISLLPLQQIEYFRTNLRISEFIGDIGPRQLPNLKTLQIDDLNGAWPNTLNHLFSACPSLENWTSPITGNMVHLFGSKVRLIKSLKLTNFVTLGHFKAIHDANLVLNELIANTSTSSIGKWSYDNILRIIRHNSNTLQVIQVTEPFLKHIVNSDLPQMMNVRTIKIRRCTKGTKISALVKFPNAVFVDVGEFH